MPFTEFMFEEDAVKASVKEMTAALKENTGRSNFKRYALGIIKRRLVKDPTRYRDYGPYWWAVKRLLADDDYYLGGYDDEEVRSAYSGSTPEETLVKADMFRTMYLTNYFVGTNQLTLDGYSGQMWVLWDEDLESSIQAMGSL